MGPGRSGDEDLLQVAKAFAEFARIADANGEPLPALDGGGEVDAAHGDLDNILHVPDVDAIAGRRFTVDIEFDVGLADDAVGDDVDGPRHFAEEFFHLQSDPLDLAGIGTEDLDAHHRSEAGLKHDDARLDRL